MIPDRFPMTLLPQKSTTYFKKIFPEVIKEYIAI